MAQKRKSSFPLPTTAGNRGERLSEEIFPPISDQPVGKKKRESASQNIESHTFALEEEDSFFMDAYESQKDNRFTESSKGPFISYVFDSREDKKLGNLHAATLGYQIFKVGIRVAHGGICRAGVSKYSITFNTYNEANLFVDSKIKLVNPFWRAFIPDSSICEIGLVFDVPTFIPIDELTDQIHSFEGGEVMKIHRIKKSINDNEEKKTIDSDIIKIFCKDNLPKFVDIFGVCYPTRNYISSVLRCFNCQKFGHGASVCSNLTKCLNCGQHHTGECSAVPCCANCGLAHIASSKDCIFFKFQREVNSLMTISKMSRSQAMMLVRQKFRTNFENKLGQKFDKVAMEYPHPFFNREEILIINQDITFINTNSDLASPKTTNEGIISYENNESNNLVMHIENPISVEKSLEKNSNPFLQNTIMENFELSNTVFSTLENRPDEEGPFNSPKYKKVGNSVLDNFIPKFRKTSGEASVDVQITESEGHSIIEPDIPVSNKENKLPGLIGDEDQQIKFTEDSEPFKKVNVSKNKTPKNESLDEASNPNHNLQKSVRKSVFKPGGSVKFLKSDNQNRSNTALQQNITIKNKNRFDILRNHENNSQSGLDMQCATKVIRALARFHALGIVAQRQYPVEFEAIKTRTNPPKYDMKILDTIYTKFMETIKRESCFRSYVSRVEDMITRYKGATMDEPLRDDPWSTIAHSDFWTNNILFRDENVKFIDFQTYMHAEVFTDLVYFLCTSLSDEMKVNHFDEMIVLYYENLVEALRRMRVISGDGDGDDGEYSRKEFNERLKKGAGKQFFHCAFAMFFFTAEVAEGDEDQEGLTASLMTCRGNDLYFQKLLQILKIYEEKGWLHLSEKVGDRQT